jgi:hypothetical protein
MMAIAAKSFSRLSLAFLVLNLLGAALYLYLVARPGSWVIPQERELGLHSVTGEPFIWALHALPIYFFFVLLNLIWGVMILFCRAWRNGRLWILSGLIWVSAVLVDFAHH